MDNTLSLWLYFKASLLSSGGLGNLPSLQDDFLKRHWASNHQFAESLTIGQIAPGPNGLWVISLGYLTNGVLGSTTALVGTVLPPLLVLLVERVYRKVENNPAVLGFVRGLTLAVCGVFLVVLITLLKANGITTKGCAIASVAMVAVTTNKIPIPAILAAAAIAGIV